MSAPARISIRPPSRRARWPFCRARWPFYSELAMSEPARISIRPPSRRARWPFYSELAMSEPARISIRPPSVCAGLEAPATKEIWVTINWAKCHTRPVLMIPGPTELPYPVIHAMSQPPTIQYDKSFDEGVLEPTTLALREVFQTKSEVLIMPGSGRTALEAGALSVIEPGDRVLVVGAGQFGILMREIMNRVGADWTEFPVEWGARLDMDRLAREAERVPPEASTVVHNETSTGTTYPAAEVGRIARSVNALYRLDTVSSIAGIDVRTDEWGVDLNMTGSQQCLAAPLGLALVSVSPRAWETMERRGKLARSLVYDLLRWKELWIPVSRGGKVPDG